MRPLWINYLHIYIMCYSTIFRKAAVITHWLKALATWTHFYFLSNGTKLICTLYLSVMQYYFLHRTNTLISSFTMEGYLRKVCLYSQQNIGLYRTKVWKGRETFISDCRTIRLNNNVGFSVPLTTYNGCEVLDEYRTTSSLAV